MLRASRGYRTVKPEVVSDDVGRCVVVLVAAVWTLGLVGTGAAQLECTTDEECAVANNACEIYACDAGRCRPSEFLECGDGIECTIDICHPVRGCIFEPVDTFCDDGNLCTQDFCSPSAGCQHPERSCATDACTDAYCDPAAGCVETPVVCNDGVGCTVDSCDPVSGCRFVPDDALCDDGTACTTDVCSVFDARCVFTATPRDDCVAGWGKTTLVVNESTPGKERVSLALKKGPAIVKESLGDPVGGSTAYALCLFDQAGTLAGAIDVVRAGDTCGTKPCWKSKKKGWVYKDADAAADGVLTLKLGGGDAGKSSILLTGKNNAAKGQTSLPVGIAPALVGATAVTAQLSGTDATACFESRVDTIKKQAATIFKATGTVP